MDNSDAIKILEKLNSTINDIKINDAIEKAIDALDELKRHSMYIEPPTKKQLVDDINKLSSQQIADKYFVSLQTLYHWKIKYDLIPIPFKKRVPNNIFKQVYQSHISVAEMATKWGVTTHTVRQRAKDMELKRPVRKHTVFSQISKEEFIEKYTDVRNSVYSLAILWNTSESNIRRKACNMQITRR